MKKKTLKEDYKHYMTVGQLLEFIKKNNIPKDGKVLIQRVEDVYFKDHGWTTLKMEGEMWHNADKWNKKVEDGTFLNKEEYPNFPESSNKKIPKKEMEAMKDEYYLVWCGVDYDGEHLYLDAQY